ncbi:GMC family oxidoreductase N-terminal domain-containing protein [Streptomyces aureus]
MSITERTDVLVIGSGFGGAIPAYHLAAGGAKVVILERGPHLTAPDFTHDLRLGSYTRIVDLVQGDGITVVAGNCVGGSSVVYFAASLRAPGFVFDRRGSLGHRLWPSTLTRAALDPWYDRVEEALPVAEQSWDQVPYPGGLFAAACARAGRTCNPVPVAVDLARCTNCNWMLNGCHFDAKRSMLLNYLPAATAHGAEIRPSTRCRPSRLPPHPVTATASRTRSSTPATTGCRSVWARSRQRPWCWPRALWPPRCCCSARLPCSAVSRKPSGATSRATATVCPSPTSTKARCATCSASSAPRASRTRVSPSGSPSAPCRTTGSMRQRRSSPVSPFSRSTSPASPTCWPRPLTRRRRAGSASARRRCEHAGRRGSPCSP